MSGQIIYTNEKEKVVFDMNPEQLKRMLEDMDPLSVNSTYFEDAEAKAKVYIGNRDSRVNQLLMNIKPYISTTNDDKLTRKVKVLYMQFPNKDEFYAQYQALLNHITYEMKQRKLEKTNEDIDLLAKKALAEFYDANVRSVMCKFTLDAYIEEQTKKREEAAKNAGSSYKKTLM